MMGLRRKCVVVFSVSAMIYISLQLFISNMKALNNMKNKQLQYNKRDVMQTIDVRLDKLSPNTDVQSICETLIKNQNMTLVKELNSLKMIRRTLPSSHYENITMNCTRYIDNNSYIIHDITQEERDFPIAFGIMIYKEIDQFERLLKAIYRPHNVYCVHIDSKAGNPFNLAVRSITSCLPNVWIASRSLDVQWGTFSVLEQEIICLQELYKHKTKWKYYINLTGQEYPLKTNYQLVKILQSYQGANDIKGEANILNKDRVKPEDPPPHNITACKGSLHMTASREFVKYVLFNQVARDFLNWSKRIRIPDETFFTSLNNNPHLRVPGSYMGERENRDRDEYSRYKIWYSPKECGSKHFVHSICMFGMADLPILTKTPHLFANKFDYQFEPLAYDCMEMWYRKNVVKEMDGQREFDVSLYKNTTYVKYRLKQ